MIEVMGQYLDEAFTSLDINAIKKVETKNNRYQVWEMSEENYEKLILWDDWQDNFGWWRKGNCIYEGSADTLYIVNGEKMYGYAPDSEKDIYTQEFTTYTDWLSEVMDLSTVKNIVIFAESLAADNGLTLAEFIAKYEI